MIPSGTLLAFLQELRTVVMRETMLRLIEFGEADDDETSYRTSVAVLKASAGEPLDQDERELVEILEGRIRSATEAATAAVTLYRDVRSALKFADRGVFHFCARRAHPPGDAPAAIQA
jgi:hypothetical protein